MKALTVLFIVLSISYLAHCQTNQPIAVIELFTSQGCSSCPAADLLLNKIVEENSTNVIGLSFHVNYWNYLGWKDPYSSQQFTDRQKLYASIKKLNNIYTPQIIVNGLDEFVGSDKQSLTHSLEKSKRINGDYELKADSRIDNGYLYVTYTIPKTGKDEVINAALVDKLVENYVPRGENSGLTLKHHNVVNTFKTQELKKTGEFSFELSSPKGKVIILYVQDKNTLEIKSATRLIL
jgi:hypothetical protein